MIFTNCGHDQKEFRNVYAIEVKQDPDRPRRITLCPKCYLKFENKFFSIPFKYRMELLV